MSEFVVTPLERETRAHITTAEAAAHLNRRPMTLYIWASKQSGPVLPVRVHGRLLWPVAGIRRALGVL